MVERGQLAAGWRELRQGQGVSEGRPQQDSHETTQGEPPARAARSSRSGNSPLARMMLILFVISPLAVLVILVILLARAIDQSADRVGRSQLDESVETTPDLFQDE